MRLVIATGHTYPPQRVGGSESSIHNICLEMLKQSIDVTVLAQWSVRQRSAFKYVRQATSLPFKHLIRDDPYGYPIYRARNPAAAVAGLVELKKPDVAIVNSGSPMLLAKQFVAFGVPCIVYLRDAFFDQLGGAISRCSGIHYITTSQALAVRIEQTLGIRPVCIPPIVIPELYRVESIRRNVTFVCPTPGKGLSTVLKLAQQRIDIPFVMVESWPLNALRRLCFEFQLRKYKNVTLNSWTPDMRTVYREAKVVLAPSLFFEGWGRVASEAQISAIPVLGSNMGGLAEAVGPGGILLDADADSKTWSMALARLWDDPVEYKKFSQLALRHSQRPEFAPARLAERLLCEIDKMLAC